jgi:hypothetical protein
LYMAVARNLHEKALITLGFLFIPSRYRLIFGSWKIQLNSNRRFTDMRP